MSYTITETRRRDVVAFEEGEATMEFAQGPGPHARVRIEQGKSLPYGERSIRVSIELVADQNPDALDKAAAYGFVFCEETLERFWGPQ